MSIGPLIDDNNFEKFIAGGGRGFQGMWNDTEGYSSAGTFDDLGIPLVDEDTIDDRIRQLEKDEATIRDLCSDLRLPPKNQGRTNYCWINATCQCAEIIRLQETGQVWNYSPASVGAPIKGFRNYGGWGWEGLKYMIDNGVNVVEDWPANAIERRYYTDENAKAKRKHRVLEYFRLETWLERVSCILAGIPTSDGYNWWRHQVAGCGIVIGSHDLIIRNSWGGWGDNGFGTLSGRKKHADGSVAITSMYPL